ncbi:MAG: cupin domain-containing protein, partial [Bacteroidales bacterium]|nr:cupin domain-containing protein [Bacteroidales bacterium]
MKTTLYFAVLALMFNACNSPQEEASTTQAASETSTENTVVNFKDYGNHPTVLNIESYTEANENFRTVLWTGTNLQVTLMTIPVGGNIG